MKRYQVFMENIEGVGKGQLFDADTLEHVWSWLDLTFSGDDTALLWWVKDREAGKVAANMQTEKTWTDRFPDPHKLITFLDEKSGF